MVDILVTIWKYVGVKCFEIFGSFKFNRFREFCFLFNMLNVNVLNVKDCFKCKKKKNFKILILMVNNEVCNFIVYFKVILYLVLSIVIMKLLKLNLDNVIKIFYIWKKILIN